jgi:hypothetical protein
LIGPAVGPSIPDITLECVESSIPQFINTWQQAIGEEIHQHEEK